MLSVPPDCTLISCHLYGDSSVLITSSLLFFSTRHTQLPLLTPVTLAVTLLLPMGASAVIVPNSVNPELCLNSIITGAFHISVVGLGEVLATVISSVVLSLPAPLSTIFPIDIRILRFWEALSCNI